MSIFAEYPTTPDVDFTSPAPVPAPSNPIKVNFIPLPYGFPSHLVSSTLTSPSDCLPYKDSDDDDSFFHDLRKALCKSIPGVLAIIAKASMDYIFKTFPGSKGNRS